MEHYVGLDVSLKETHYCVVDGTGAVVFRGREATHPELLARALRAHAPAARVVVLETGVSSGDSILNSRLHPLSRPILPAWQGSRASSSPASRIM